MLNYSRGGVHAVRLNRLLGRWQKLSEHAASKKKKQTMRKRGSWKRYLQLPLNLSYFLLLGCCFFILGEIRAEIRCPFYERATLQPQKKRNGKRLPDALGREASAFRKLEECAMFSTSFVSCPWFKGARSCLAFQYTRENTNQSRRCSCGTIVYACFNLRQCTSME